MDEWRPACSPAHLHLRAQILQEIRGFFSERSVLEVETPLLCHGIGTDPQLEFFTADYCLPPLQQTLFLQTSPEFAMKRLLAAGSGSIYQICKAFRNGESGRFHNPEFTLLEWYRVGFKLPQLMDEIDELAGQLFRPHRSLNAPQRFSYQELFLSCTGLNPLVFSYKEFCAYAVENHLPEAAAICRRDHSVWLDFIFSHKVQPHLGNNALCMVYGYPACQSSLARINQYNPRITDRVELFFNGIELGNGYYELADPEEQNRRFNEEIIIRQQRKLPAASKDNYLISALQSGLPECSGMAIGLDRLLMALTDSTAIDEVLSFPMRRA
ncbi:Elongation factor P--(R)-beta-lysine ligase [Candidatus Methylobacter favarea]|uniref:Elongation factor P--(R)-beta-lysine ligase n=1 Tax=Candidatus Methylobacter favarea TaxID=2707345 RepID=A0A8S0XEC1_9GAMM|nr:EF-P lysine aminoacylase EpmA [Candidatus Methylobacter favarea]CAA9889582.1 Elongation factor P--(R)-beta-lysine ligase [Candidatus Methylobacter favarea]